MKSCSMNYRSKVYLLTLGMSILAMVDGFQPKPKPPFVETFVWPLGWTSKNDMERICDAFEELKKEINTVSSKVDSLQELKTEFGALNSRVDSEFNALNSKVDSVKTEVVDLKKNNDEKFNGLSEKVDNNSWKLDTMKAAQDTMIAAQDKVIDAMAAEIEGRADKTEFRLLQKDVEDVKKGKVDKDIFWKAIPKWVWKRCRKLFSK